MHAIPLSPVDAVPTTSSSNNTIRNRLSTATATPFLSPQQQQQQQSYHVSSTTSPQQRASLPSSTTNPRMMQSPPLVSGGSNNIRKIDNKLRIRDIIAIGIAIILTKMSYNNKQINTTSLQASIKLQWFIPRHPYADATYNFSSSTASNTIMNSNDEEEGNNENNSNRNNNTSNQMIIPMKSSTSTSIVIPQVLDIDGDGISEAIVTVTQKRMTSSNKDDPWLVQVLNMKPIMKGNINRKNRRYRRTTDNNNMNENNPFIHGFYRPEILFESNDITKRQFSDSSSNDQDALLSSLLSNDKELMQLYRHFMLMNGPSPLTPLDMITAHVILRPNEKDDEQSEEESQTAPTHNRTLQFFCGTDWHDASKKCAVHCPSGQSTDCPNGERCYADTPCSNMLPKPADSSSKVNHDSNEQTLYNTTTPAGGWPSVFTLWSNGYITMHSITIKQPTKTNNITNEDTATKRKDNKKKKKTFPFQKDGGSVKDRLQLQFMWKTKLPLLDDEEEVSSSDNNDNNEDTNNNHPNKTSSSSSSSSKKYSISENSYHWNDIAMSYADAISVNNGAGYVIVKGNSIIYPSPQKQMDIISNISKETGGSYDFQTIMQHMMRRGISFREPMGHVDFMVAINVEDGTIGWKSQQTLQETKNRHLNYILQDDEKSVEEKGQREEVGSDPLFNSIIQRGSMSTARRRSRIPGLSDHNNNINTNNNDLTKDNRHKNDIYQKHYHIFSQSNCLREYRYSILTSPVLPHYYFSEEDTRIDTLHFEHQGVAGQNKKKHNYGSKTNAKNHRKKYQPSSNNANKQSNDRKGLWSSLFSSFSSSSSSSQSSSREKVQYENLHFGKPNVVVVHDRYGIMVHSLRNGRTLCHLSLPNEVVYVDMNHDGTIDGISSIVADPDDTESILTEPDYDGEYDDEYYFYNRNNGNIQEKAWNDAARSFAQDQSKWVKQLAQRLQKNSNNNKDVTQLNRHLEQDPEQEENEMEESSVKNENVDSNKQRGTTTPLCHLLALSGIPAKEELFTMDLCGRKKKKKKYPKQKLANMEEQSNDEQYLISTPPLIVEPLLRTGMPSRSRDVVTAISNGIITRVRGYDGRKQWQRKITQKMLDPLESNNAIIPHSDDPALYTLQRINVQNALPKSNDGNDDDDESSAVALGHRPILWTGENSMVLMSATYGTVLSYVPYPQSILVQPYVVDYNGDGTSDVILMSRDAIWGYTVKVHVTTSIVYRLIWGVLFLFLLLGFVQNQFQSQPGKRSTDL